MNSNCDIVLIDNFDSFTYNLVDQFEAMGIAVKVYRNSVCVQDLECVLQSMDNPLLVLSPGPGTPAEAGNLLPIVTHFQSRYPMLGICLGHQAIVQHFGGTIAKADSVVHGKASHLSVVSDDLFDGMNHPIRIGRYHSLAAFDIPESLRVIATVDDYVMAVKSDALKILGFQFHPESILSTDGQTLLSNAIRWLLTSD